MRENDGPNNGNPVQPISKVEQRARGIIRNAKHDILTIRNLGSHGNESNKELLKSALRMKIAELRRIKSSDSQAGAIIKILQKYIDHTIDKLTNQLRRK